MTEIEWLVSNNPREMLKAILNMSDHKLRMYVLASAKLAGHEYRGDEEPFLSITYGWIDIAENWSIIPEFAIERAALLREILGNPYRRATLAFSKSNSRVVSMAQAIYDTRDFDSMPVLGDLLQESGCTDARILSHCLNGGPHVRGCWVIDLILGKE